MDSRIRLTLVAVALVAALTVPTPLQAGLPPGSKVLLTPPATINSVDRPSSAIWVDLDGDGDLDVVGSEGPDGSSGEVFWFERNHSGGFFGPKQTIDTFPGAQVVHAADLDDDGDHDLVATSFFTGDVAWFENTAGDASAWTQHSLASGIPFPDDVTSADLDDDGDLDVIVAIRGNPGIARIYINDGTPATGAWSSEDAGTLSGTGSVAAGDIDGDGDLDLAVSGRAGDSVVWYQNGSLALDTWTPRTIETSIDSPIHTRLADIDGDGDLDAVVTAGGSADAIGWWENDGDPTDDVGDWQAHAIDASLAGAYHLSALDFDLDGDIDVVATGEDAAEVRSYDNLDGSGQEWQQATVLSALDGARWSDLGDFDKDGDLDLLVVANGMSDDEVAYLANDSSFQTGDIDSRVVAWTSPAQLVDAVAAGDIDGDGDTDLVGGGLITWLENTDGRGTAWTPRTVDPAFNASSVRVADIDRDGNLDLVVANGTGGSLNWYESDGSPADGSGGGLGTSWTLHSIEAGDLDSVQDIEVGDIDGDDHLDVVATANLDDLILWWQSDGSPADDGGGDGNSWTQRTIAAAPDTENARTIRLGDIDGDGDIDVVSVAQTGGERVSWWENNGSGTSWTATQIASGQNLGAVVFDFENDGDLDVATAEGISDSIVVHRNISGDGSGWAAGGQLFPLGALDPTAEFIVAGDFDLDGDNDLAFSIESQDVVIWLDNDSPGVSIWSDHTIDTTGEAPRSLAVADIDGDGDGDLVAGIRSDRQVVWYRNESGQFALVTSDQAPAPDPGSEDDLLKIVLSHSGRAGDDAVELATVELLLEETAGDPLSEVEAQDLFAEINLYADDGDGIWNGADTLLHTETVFSLDDGVLTLELPDNEVDLTATVGATRTLFVTALLTSTADQSPPVSFRASHLTSSSSRGENADHDTSLRLAWEADTASTLVVLVDCYELTLSHVGFGHDPVPDLASSASCPAGTYVDGQEITLTATPDPDYVVGGWSGSDDDGSTSTENTVTMPALAHAASVTYVFPDHIVISNETLTGVDVKREACLSITAGPTVTVPTGSFATLRAADKIALNDGFAVQSGAFLVVDLETPDRCTP